MSDPNEPNGPLMDHDYDGIQEYDNPLPNWWLWGFFGTIIFGFIYLMHYTVGSGPTLQEELQVSMSHIEGLSAQGPKSDESEEELSQMMGKQGVVANGKALFATRCAVCHGENGQGLIGPNLTDNYWIHGQGTRKTIIAIIRQGVPEKGMPSWEPMLKSDEIMAVAAHVYSLKGTRPPNPKAPQGEEIK
jgi:cytochrome c oxidase cbb3-type subunit 3